MKRLLLITLFTFTVNAAPYVGVFGGLVDSDQVTGLTLGYGGKVFSAEARIAKGWDIDVTGIYGKATFPATISPYMLIGWSDVDTDDGLSWGIGISWEAEENISLSAEYMAYTGYLQPDEQGANFGLTYKW